MKDFKKQERKESTIKKGSSDQQEQRPGSNRSFGGVIKGRQVIPVPEGDKSGLSQRSSEDEQQ